MTIKRLRSELDPTQDQARPIFQAIWRYFQRWLDHLLFQRAQDFRSKDQQPSWGISTLSGLPTWTEVFHSSRASLYGLFRHKPARWSTDNSSSTCSRILLRKPPTRKQKFRSAELLATDRQNSAALGGQDESSLTKVFYWEPLGGVRHGCFRCYIWIHIRTTCR